MPGRKPVPQQLKKIRGTDQPCRQNKRPPEFDVLVKPPPAPAFFKKNALGRKIWRDTCRDLIAANMLDRISIQGLVMYVRAYSNYLLLEEQLAEEGVDRTIEEETKAGKVKRIDPRHKIANDEFNKALAIGREYGLTPASRVKTMKLDNKDPEEDFFS